MKIGILLGDDIGLEVVPEAVKVMRAAAAKTGLAIQWQDFPIGRRGHELHGHTFPQVTIDGLAMMDGWLLGPIGHSAYPRNDPTWIMPPVRKRFDLFASIKPVKSYPGIKALYQDLDLVLLREVTEGMQSWDNVFAGSGEFMPNDEIAVGFRVITRAGAERVAREAFEIARGRRKKLVTAVHKEPVYRLCCGVFAQECRKVAAQYPDVRFSEVLVDTFCAKLVTDPYRFDVVVTSNQFGDIITDLGAALVGGLGLAPGLCAGVRQAMSQATHGSAPDIAGKAVANPYAPIMSGKMLLAWLGRKHAAPEALAAADLIDAAMARVIAQAKFLTPDMGGAATTMQMGDAVVAAL